MRPMNHAGAVPELAGPADLPDLVVTCAAAFSDDPMIRWPMPDATPAMLQELFRVILTPYLEFGVLWKIHGCDGGAAWLPPGVTGRFDEIEQSARAAINPLTGDGGARYAAFWDWLGAHLPREPCWFLDLVAVAPAAQGQGLTGHWLRTAWIRPGPREAPPSWKPAPCATCRTISPSASRS